MAKPGSHSPHLEPFQQEQAAAHAPLQAVVVHEVIRGEGAFELERPVAALFWSGLAAGLSMGFSFVAQALLRHDLAGAAGQHAIASFGYAVGFVIVVLGRQQLFTESTLSAVLPVLSERTGKTTAAMFRLWGVVLAANLVGTWIFAAALAWLQPFPPEAASSFAYLADEAVRHPFADTLVRAVFAGWLIALMVWLLPPSGPTRILVIALLAWAVALGKFSHIIAGSTEAAYGVLTGHAGAVDYVWRFLLPTLLGNTLGGVALVALLNHAPVSHEVGPAETAGAKER
jgi:formate/nitrite transporter FocA (FNT family)